MLKIILRILAPFCWPGRKIKTASENHHGHNETQTNFEANDHILQIGKDMSESTRAALDVEFRNISPPLNVFNLQFFTFSQMYNIQYGKDKF